MHKSKARKETLRLKREQRAQRKAENRLRLANAEKSRRVRSRTERLMYAAAISAFVLGLLVWTERLNYALGGAVQIALLIANGLLIHSLHRLPQSKQPEALLLTEALLGYEAAMLLFLRQPLRYVFPESLCSISALVLFSALCLSLAPPLLHMREKIRLLPHAFVLTILLFSFSILWTNAVNVSLDFHPAQEIAAECIDRRTGRTGRGGRFYRIKLAFPLSDGSSATHWFDVTHPQYFENSYSLLRLPGALGVIWYEPYFSSP